MLGTASSGELLEYSPEKICNSYLRLLYSDGEHRVINRRNGTISERSIFRMISLTILVETNRRLCYISSIHFYTFQVQAIQILSRSSDGYHPRTRQMERDPTHLWSSDWEEQILFSPWVPHALQQNPILYLNEKVVGYCIARYFRRLTCGLIPWGIHQKGSPFLSQHIRESLLRAATFWDKPTSKQTVESRIFNWSLVHSQNAHVDEIKI